MKVAVVTCYRQNDYIRARSLRTAVATAAGVKPVVVRNRHTGWLRYPEIVLRLCKTRLIDRPDAYIITFRGYELLLLMVLSLVRKPIVFDELVNFTEWMTEHGRLREGSFAYRLFRAWYGWLARRPRLILADTDAHAQQSAILNKLSIKRYRVLPVSADETVFRPAAIPTPASKPFTVLYYGSMLPLHGLEYVLQAAVLLADRPDIEFRIIGGKQQLAQACQAAITQGARIDHQRQWIPFEALPQAIGAAGLTLGGPFGGTLQSQFVVTGKTYQVLACAAPVLIGRNQVNEGFTDRKNCLMVPQADAEALAETIHWAADHPKELARIGRAGRQLYDKHFSQAHINRLVADMLQEVSREHR